MRTRLIVWGTNAKEEKVLLAVSLNADENKVDIWSIPENEITEEFYNLMMSQWRDGLEVKFPATSEHRITELTMAESILPDDLKVEKSDVIQRAQMEWHFVILSTKLYKNFKNELEDVSDKIKRLEVFDQPIWDELKELWSNVQQHIFDKNLFRDHADSLREKSNALFDSLKKLRKNLSAEINQKSKEVAEGVHAKLSEILNKISSGALLKPLFDQLITIQKEMHGLQLTKGDRESLVSKLNEAFRNIREKREHRETNKEQHGGGSDHIIRRYEGLITAIKKMEQSIDFEKKNIDFENRRIATTSGQLEAQIRVAKIKMIEERIRSKEEKLKELLATREKLEILTQKIKKREEKMKSKQDRNAKIAEEQEKVKAKITEEIHHVHEQIPGEVQEKLTKAAEEIKSAKRPVKRKPKTEQVTLNEGNEPPVDNEVHSTPNAEGEVEVDAIPDAAEVTGPVSEDSSDEQTASHNENSVSEEDNEIATHETKSEEE